jgi:membrane-bound ClpP family serine protease
MRFLFLYFLFLFFFVQAASAQVVVVELKDTITPASGDIVYDALRNAQP